MNHYTNADRTIGAITTGNHSVVVEPDHPRWAEFLASGPAAYVPPVAEPSLDAYRTAVQAHIDAAAIARRYDSGVSLASYTASTNPAWQAEALAFTAWRDAVWSQVYALEAAVLAGEAAPPTIEALIADLPGIVWP